MRGKAPLTATLHPNTVRHHQRQDAARRGQRRCPLDGTLLEFTTNGAGRLLEACPACDRRRAGLCQDCGQPRTTRCIRCPQCRHRAAREAQRRFREAHREQLNAKARAYQRRRRGVPGPGRPRATLFRRAGRRQPRTES